MSEAFDPYYLWLAIPPSEQPPNHYRLLGVTLFETNADVIETAADGRMGLLRTFQTGRHSDASQKLLNEVAAGRVCLLNPTKKAAYDSALRRELEPQRPAQPLPVAEPLPERQPLEHEASEGFLSFGTAPRTMPAGRVQRQRQESQWLVIAAAVLGGLMVLGVILLAFTSSKPATNVALPRTESPTSRLKGHSSPPSKGRPRKARGDVTPLTPLTPVIPPLPVTAPPPADQPQAPTPAATPAATAEQPPSAVDPAPPPARNDSRRILLIFKDDELEVAIAACKQYGLAYDTASSYDMNRQDYYSTYHTVISGSNKMDYWRAEERKKPEAFRHLEAFVNDGGHLIVTGSYNGRYNDHLGRFGIRTSYYHNRSFERAGPATDLLFLGNEAMVPSDKKMQSAGNFSCSSPHTVLLKRGPGSYAGEPALITLQHQKGRVTFTLVEPGWKNDSWLITVLLSWVSRGCPT